MTRLLQLCAVVMSLTVAACGGDRGSGVADGTAIVDADSPRDLARVVTQIMPSLERLSGLDRIETLRVRRQPRDDARSYMERRLAEEMPPAELDAIRRTYVALGLLPDTLDLTSLLLDLYTEQVLGYYDPAEETLYVVAGQNAPDLRSLIAHELVHALQDQHTNLDSLVARERGNDAQTAAHAAMEGHALLVMFAILAEEATGQRVDPAALPSPADELSGALDAQNSEFPVFRRAPLVIRETLLFPYVGGAGFVHALWSSLQPRDRYPAPIDSLLPQTTAQVMQPHERFIGGRTEPVPVRVAPPPTGWTELRRNDLGQLETAIFLAHHLGSGARAIADGWAGDGYALLVAPGGSDVLDWWSAWVSDEAADRFAAAVVSAAGRRPGRHVAVERISMDGAPGVRVVDAPSEADARALRQTSR
jgi:hypothetical protein